MSNPVCAVIGVGPGNGTAIARKFSSEGYKIALLSRNEDYLNGLAHELGDRGGMPMTPWIQPRRKRSLARLNKSSELLIFWFMGLRGIEWANLGSEGARKLCIS